MTSAEAVGHIAVATVAGAAILIYPLSTPIVLIGLFMWIMRKDKPEATKSSRFRSR